jgi:hypothetical protein
MCYWTYMWLNIWNTSLRFLAGRHVHNPCNTPCHIERSPPHILPTFLQTVASTTTSTSNSNDSLLLPRHLPIGQSVAHMPSSNPPHWIIVVAAPLSTISRSFEGTKTPSRLTASSCNYRHHWPAAQQTRSFHHCDLAYPHSLVRLEYVSCI